MPLAPRSAGLVLLAASAAWAADPPPVAKPDPHAVRRLIERLGSDDYDAREAATHELAKLDDIPDELRAAADAIDPEVSRRAHKALKAIVARVGDKAFDALVAELRKQPFDKIVRRVTADPASDHGAPLKVIDALAKLLTKRAAELAETDYGLPEFDAKALSDFDGTTARGCRILVGEQAVRPQLGQVDGCLVVCVGDLPRLGSVRNSVVLIDGNFGGASQVVNSLLVVRGHVGRVMTARGSVVLTSGDFEGSTILHGSFFQVGGKFGPCRTARGNVYVKTAPDIAAGVPAVGLGSKTLDTDAGPLQSINFGKDDAPKAEKK